MYSYPLIIPKKLKDESINFGKTVDFSIQIQKAGYKLYYAPNSIVKHMHRVDMGSFNKQWYGYGKGHAFLVQKHATQVFEVVLQFVPGAPRIKLPIGLQGLVYLGNFHMTGLLGFLATLTLIVGGLTMSTLMLQAGGIFALLFLFFAIRYFKGCLSLAPKRSFFTWCKIRWVTNWWFIKGGIEGTKKTGIVYVEPSW